MKNISELAYQDFSFEGPHEPSQQLALSSKTKDGNVIQGVWESGPGELDLEFNWHETVFILEGKATVFNKDTEESFTLTPGVLSIFEKGSRWKWHIPWRLKKVFTTIS